MLNDNSRIMDLEAWADGCFFFVFLLGPVKGSRGMIRRRQKSQERQEDFPDQLWWVRSSQEKLLESTPNLSQGRVGRYLRQESKKQSI